MIFWRVTLPCLLSYQEATFHLKTSGQIVLETVLQYNNLQIMLDMIHVDNCTIQMWILNSKKTLMDFGFSVGFWDTWSLYCINCINPLWSHGWDGFPGVKAMYEQREAKRNPWYFAALSLSCYCLGCGQPQAEITRHGCQIPLRNCLAWPWDMDCRDNPKAQLKLLALFQVSGYRIVPVLWLRRSLNWPHRHSLHCTSNTAVLKKAR